MFSNIPGSARPEFMTAMQIGVDDRLAQAWGCQAEILKAEANYSNDW
jgi:hypothetical protein